MWFLVLLRPKSVTLRESERRKALYQLRWARQLGLGILQPLVTREQKTIKTRMSLLRYTG